ncbi:LOW QUALITY PROTEIN: probable protein disulfide-isomerase A4 [Daphnia carinata]|uniref:LOW QUALITY PROTEIN: probable protein disulfide-isomerase A4 n=1 Tax=Daphnia carinata TaxID=120202 RepID=UPI00257F961B|nr:LOW QUALITY PROTEIN: probable protein disulfide-isomerase A4 [Daphnia carinata]
MLTRRDWPIFILLSSLFCISFAAEQAEFIPNDGDIQVVDGRGGNYKFIEEDEVIILTRENFHYFIMSRPTVLVEFYAPWCGHCKDLVPEYSKAAETLKKENIPLAKVDATKEGELAVEFMISGYPSLILFRDGKKIDQYQGERNAFAIIDYMREKTDPNWKPPLPPVIELTSENFEKTVTDSKLILVQFYAPYCSHCKQMQPEYEAAARSLLEYGIPLAKVDGTSEKALTDSFQITGYPQMRVFRKGRVFEYKGPREHRGIVDHMKELARPASKLVNSLGELKSEMDRTEATVVGFFSSKSPLYEEYMAASEELRGILTCLHTFEKDVASHYKVIPDSIVVYQPEIFHSEYEKSSHEFLQLKARGNAKDIVNFVKEKSVPLVGQRTKRNEAFKYSTKPLIVVYYDVNFDHQYVKDTQFIRKKVLEVAKIFQNSNAKFAISNEDEYLDELRSLNLADVNEDIKVAAFDGQKFRMEPMDEFDPQEVKKFIDSLSSGKGKPYYKSQPVPKVQEGPVLNVVANSFAEEVLQPKKDVLIEFYAPWCGHCKALEPEYKKLAKKMKKANPNLIVAKMDATANDLHPIFGQIKGYPTIFFLPVAHKQEPVPYTGGDFTYKSLKTFVDQQSSVILTDEERMGLPSIEKREVDEL